MRQRLVQAFAPLVDRVGSAAVVRGMPPAWTGYRFVPRQGVAAFCAEHAGRGARYETVHAEGIASHPLPCNVAARDELIDEPGWWGFSFRDVPARRNGETFVATIPDARIVWYRDQARDGDFVPAIPGMNRVALDFREMRFRPPHAVVLRSSGTPQRLAHATWVIERVYHNYSHWLTAHLPKLLLLRQRGALSDVLLPPERIPAIDESLGVLGLTPERLPTFDPARPLRVDALTIVGTDRFRPELLRLVPEACGISAVPLPRRRVFVSRARAARRRLLNEEHIWALLEPAGFERVHMEDLSVEQQVTLMRETSVLCALHGAGLANMLFCPPGAHVIEIADPGFPNPNFYAMAAALRHHYWLLFGRPVTTDDGAPPGWRDLTVDAESVRGILPRIPSSSRQAPAPDGTRGHRPVQTRLRRSGADR